MAHVSRFPLAAAKRVHDGRGVCANHPAHKHSFKSLAERSLALTNPILN